MSLARIVGWNIRERRLRLRLSQEELSFRADMKRSYLSELENGKRNPSLKAIERIAAGLGVDALELFRPNSMS